MLCPQNGKVGLEVPLKTVKNFLTGKALARMDPASPHYLCQDPACPVVYYGQEGVFLREEVRFPIYDKGASLVCYCFDWTREGLAEALRQGQDPVAQVEEGVRTKRCACDQRNPRGRCCFSTLKAEVARLA
ncbi:copper chaperone Copz family protein [Thermus caldilimi]|uniref:copper chaperone Copz family protein n=1 Tax=Thermus caldilimi TaxID=2483360 RepID=UPI001076AEA3|nr:copper chaperone Copz family protein [Thermus caldilimi]